MSLKIKDKNGNWDKLKQNIIINNNVSVSKETGNIIQETPDGLFAPKIVSTSNEEPTDESVILWINPDAADEDEDLLSTAVNTAIQNSETIQTMSTEIADLKKKMEALMNN